jgi:hypothetical protein
MLAGPDGFPRWWVGLGGSPINLAAMRARLRAVSMSANDGSVSDRCHGAWIQRSLTTCDRWPDTVYQSMTMVHTYMPNAQVRVTACAVRLRA